MPATAGRVRMPANNRVHSSAALQTHGIWQSAIGYDPYAPEKDSKEKSSGGKPEADGRAENAYASFQGLLALARITGSSANDTRGACKKCGRIGHLTYQCRNFLSVKEDKEKDEATLQNATVVFDKIKKASGMKEEDKESSEEEEDSDSSDSDADSEIERIIAARSGKNRKKVDKDDGSKEKKRERRGRSKKRSGKRARRGYDDDADGDKEDDAKRKEKRHRRRYASSDEGSSEEERGRKVKKLRKRHAGSDDDGSDEDNRHRHHRKSRKERKRRSHH